MLPAIGGSAAALSVISHRGPTPLRLHAGALLMAAGIGTMHYTGMEAMSFDGLRYDPALFALSLVVAYVLALAALHLNVRVRRLVTITGYGLRIGAGVGLGLAVAAMHYTAMHAARFYQLAEPAPEQALVSDAGMAAAISAFAAFVLTIGLIATWMDKQRAAHRKLQQLVRTDELTGLPNRTLFSERLEEAIARGGRNHRKVAVLFLDLNDFKTINDSLGHSVGDEMLRRFATRLRGSLRRGDVVARFGGDEFIVLAEDLASSEDVTDVVIALQRAMEEPIELDDLALHMGASIGISICPDNSVTAEELMQQADAAMYWAKQEAVGYRFFDDTLTARALRRVRLGNDLRAGLDRGELYLDYQPWVDLASGEWLGYEALARWTHPTEGPISPGVFIPLAERTGFVLQLGAWVLHEACTTARQWLDAGVEFQRVAVNVAAQQVSQEKFFELVAATLEDTGLGGKHLELEITESSLMGNDPGTLERLRRIRALGVTLSIDDFGTGYSSLLYLKDLPVDKLKIDQGFVRSMLTDTRDQAIIRAVTDMGARLGYTVVAEGIESAAQRDALLEAGCRFGQGFLFGVPDRHGNVFCLSPEAVARR